MAAGASAFAIAVEAPQNGYAVVVPRDGLTWLRFTVLFRVQGCKHEGGVVSTRFSNMRFSPARGSGERWFEMLVHTDNHNLVRQMGPIPYTEAGFTVAGDASIPGYRVSNGELLRWTITAFCLADTGDPLNDEVRTTTTGTVRIKLASGSGTRTQIPPNHVVPFLITRIDSPSSVRQNGVRGIATIHWSGHPTFPVTMHDAPASCPTGFTCSSETNVATKRANPLTWAAWWCAGSVTSNWTLDYWFWLTDAKGEQTQRVREQVICNVG